VTVDGAVVVGAVAVAAAAAAAAAVAIEPTADLSSCSPGSGIFPVLAGGCLTGFVEARVSLSLGADAEGKEQKGMNWAAEARPVEDSLGLGG